MSRWLCALVLAAPFAAAQTPPESKDAEKPAATVNGEEIRLDQVSRNPRAFPGLTSRGREDRIDHEA